jgi:predicted PurR-regulated permease PerM
LRPDLVAFALPLAGLSAADMTAAMDAPTTKQDAAGEAKHVHALAEAFTAKRDRLLAALTLIGGIGLIVALPFALRAGAEFFLPVTAALVIAIALVPMLEWFERHGVPSKLAAALCVLLFLAFAFFAIGSIVLPAIDWIALIPERIDQVRATLEPLLDLYNAFDRFVEGILSQIAAVPDPGRVVTIETPNSLSGLLATSAPHLISSSSSPCW